MLFPPCAVRLHAAAGDSDAGGGVAALIDPQNIQVAPPSAWAPHEIPDGPPAEKAAPEKKDAPDPRLTAMETDLATLRRQNAELSASERYWADQAKNRRDADPDEETELLSHETAAPITETAEEFLDDVSKRGMKAIKDRGFMTQAEVAQMVAEGVATANQNLQEARTDATFDTQLAQEFPDIAADYRLIQAGKQPVSPLFKRASEIFRETVRLDPNLGKSKSALIMAARTAQAQIAAEGKGKSVSAGSEDDENRQTRRRDRIDRQRPDRAAGGSDENDDTPGLTADQKIVIKNLNVAEKDFLKNSDRRASGR